MCAVTSAVGQSIQSVAFVAETLKTARGVHTIVVTGPLKKTFIYMYNHNQRDDIVAGQLVVFFMKISHPQTLSRV